MVWGMGHSWTFETEGMGKAEGSLLEGFGAYLDQRPSKATIGTTLCFSCCLLGWPKKLIQVCPSHPTEKPNDHLVNPILVSPTQYELLPRQRGGRQASSHMSMDLACYTGRGPKLKHTKTSRSERAGVKGEVQQRRKTWGEWTPKSNTMRGRWTVVSTGKDFAQRLESWQRPGLKTRGQVEKGLRGGE